MHPQRAFFLCHHLNVFYMLLRVVILALFVQNLLLDCYFRHMVLHCTVSTLGEIMRHVPISYMAKS
jgi:hypothetical protein